MLYNLSRRAPEFELFPICQELNIPIMAYSPIEQGRILGNPVLRDIAARHDASPVQIALAWVLLQTAFAPSRGQAGPSTPTRTARRSRSAWIAMTWSHRPASSTGVPSRLATRRRAFGQVRHRLRAQRPAERGEYRPGVQRGGFQVGVLAVGTRAPMAPALPLPSGLEQGLREFTSVAWGAAAPAR